MRWDIFIAATRKFSGMWRRLVTTNIDISDLYPGHRESSTPRPQTSFIWPISKSSFHIILRVSCRQNVLSHVLHQTVAFSKSPACVIILLTDNTVREIIYRVQTPYTYSHKIMSVIELVLKCGLLLRESEFDDKMFLKKKKLAASSMLHEAKVAYYAFDVAARFLIWLFMPFLWLRWYGGLWAVFAGRPCCCLCCCCHGCACVISCAMGTVRDLGGWSLWSSIIC